MKFERIQLFVQIVEKGSFSVVAREARVSTAAVSKQIALLEQEAHVKLLRRTTRSVVPTEAGVVYYEQCRKVLQEYLNAEALISKLSVEPSGKLKVVSSPYWGEKYILPRLKEFLVRYPKLVLELEFAERMPDLSKEEIDVIFGMSMAGPENSIQKKIGSTRYVLCASPQYLKARGTPLKIQDLKSHSYIGHSKRRFDDRLNFKNKREIHIQPSLWLNDTRTMLNCAVQGIGIAKLHRNLVEEYIQSGLLAEILPNELESQIPVYLYYREDRYLHPKVRHFIDFFSRF
jgi:DNA-binding transcriptional LysR family regulator